MSHERSGREGTPEAAPSKATTTVAPSKGTRSRQKKINWDKVRVFDKPEFMVPFRFPKYRGGKNPFGVPGPELWVQAAVESGLVRMEPFDPEKQRGAWFEPLEDHPPREMNKSLDELLDEGIADTLRKLEKL